MTSGSLTSAELLVAGTASGAVMVLDEPLSFWGGLDSGNGKIIDHWMIADQMELLEQLGLARTMKSEFD